MRVEYSSNNSGGRWWLTDQNWRDLEAAGWNVKWAANEKGGFLKADKEGRWLGALAMEASRDGVSLGTAIREWERVTRLNANALGCSCCGTPHNFELYGDNGEYSPDYPGEGGAYDGE